MQQIETTNATNVFKATIVFDSHVHQSFYVPCFDDTGREIGWGGNFSWYSVSLPAFRSRKYLLRNRSFCCCMTERFATASSLSCWFPKRNKSANTSVKTGKLQSHWIILLLTWQIATWILEPPFLSTWRRRSFTLTMWMGFQIPAQRLSDCPPNHYPITQYL